MKSSVAWLSVGVLWWLVNAVVSVALGILGVPIVAALCAAKAWTRRTNPLSQVPGAALWQFSPAWAWLWSNEEIGIYTGTGAPTFGAVFAWTAWRNKVSNLRFVRPWYCRVNPPRVASFGNSLNIYLAPRGGTQTLWSLTWQGIYAGLWIRWTSWQFRVGFTLVPADADGLNPIDLRQMYCPFSIELQRVNP